MSQPSPGPALPAQGTPIPEALVGERVDRVVATLTGLARAEVAALVAAGRVRLVGRPVSARSRRVARGEVLEVDLPRPSRPTLVPEPDVPVTLVHVDDDVVVVDKQAGLVVHPGAGHVHGTLVNGLLARFPEMAEVGDPERPGIVHRLDRMTSGLLAVARTDFAHRALAAQLSQRSMGRRYLALVWGDVKHDTGVVDAPLGRSARDPTRMAVRAQGRPARTGYRVVARMSSPEDLTLLECRLETGRTHQIRVHLAAIGHPVVGDGRYRGARPGLVLARPFLHATGLAFDHPATGARLELTSALPPELDQILARLAKTTVGATTAVGEALPLSGPGYRAPS